MRIERVAYFSEVDNLGVVHYLKWMGRFFQKMGISPLQLTERERREERREERGEERRGGGEERRGERERGERASSNPLLVMFYSLD